MSDKLEQQLEELLKKIEAESEFPQLRETILGSLDYVKGIISGYENRINQLEHQLAERVKTETLNNCKDGVLKLQFGGYPHKKPWYENVEVIVDDGQNTIYLNTDFRGLCERKLPGGNYTLCVEGMTRSITIDGNTKFKFKDPESF